ncbi:MAG: tRNA uridine-5-carboxymethylaminomethyl(34) synthesis enzyme MnmG, partial [Candidatus Subteraquimicrobiales bacterium]|nr:tRNA uridine-5-carboxymethylaminomethyl(34) synthesis enzyme MnmG [Candidatus Subteraquimicrobiales bacterium]
YRLVLRSGNADLRLSPTGHKLGLISTEQMEKVKAKQRAIQMLKKELEETTLAPDEWINQRLKEWDSPTPKEAVSCIKLLRRPEINMERVLRLIGKEAEVNFEVAEEVEADVKYAGYIEKQMREIQRHLSAEKVKIPQDIEYHELKGLSFEAREHLSRVRPHSLGQASRVGGVSPADISVLMIYLEQIKRRRAHS